MSLGPPLEQIENGDYPTRRIEGKTRGSEFSDDPWIVLDELVEPSVSMEMARIFWRTGKYTVVRVVNERTGFTSDTIQKDDRSIR
jgi:hypothetical protein